MSVIVRRSSVPPQLRYQQYKPFLRDDFSYRCAYCNIHENEFGGLRHYHVDHFRPKSRFPKLETEYQNLLYACGICNGHKGNDWPSDDPVRDGKGYLDPCVDDYADHFGRDGNTLIDKDSAVAAYMIVRLHLNRPQLLTMRLTRREIEQRHRQALIHIRMCVQLIDLHLTRADLAADDRRELEEARVLILTERRNENVWHRRLWKPHINEDDYR
jgi:uncharacterized protein (TIGR02646 family)